MNEYGLNRDTLADVLANTSQAGSEAPDAAGGATGFAENMRASAGLVWREESSLSETAFEQGYRDRNALLQGKIAGGEIRQDVVDRFTSRKIDYLGMDYGRGHTRYAEVDWSAMADYAREAGHFDVQVDSELEAIASERLRIKREQAHDVFARSDGWGTAGRFVGAIGVSLADPITAASLAIPGATVARGASVGQTVFRVARAEAAIGGATEAVLQKQIFDFKERIDSPYTVTDALAGVAMTAAGGAVLGGIIGGARGLRGKRRDAAARQAFSDELESVNRRLKLFKAGDAGEVALRQRAQLIQRQIDMIDGTPDPRPDAPAAEPSGVGAAAARDEQRARLAEASDESRHRAIDEQFDELDMASVRDGGEMAELVAIARQAEQDVANIDALITCAIGGG